MSRIVVLIPAFNEGGSLPALLRELAAAQPNWAVVVINDGSTDSTAHAALHGGAIVLSLPFNAGLATAEQTGLLWAKENDFDCAVRLDGDGQHPPREAQKLVAPILAGEADMVIGSRFLAPSAWVTTRSRAAGIRWLAFVLTRLSGQKITDPTSGFRAFGRRALMMASEVYPEGYPEPESTLLMARNGLRLMEVPVEMTARTAGRSTIRWPGALGYLPKVTLALLVETFRRPLPPGGSPHS